VPRLRDILDRFRPAGAPGAAGAAGVPADRVAESTAELAPLFTALAATETECAAIRDAGRADAAKIRQTYADRADATVAAARTRTAAERATALTEITRRSDTEAADARARADREAADLRAAMAVRLPGFVDHAVALVRGFAGDADTGGSP